MLESHAIDQKSGEAGRICRCDMLPDPHLNCDLPDRRRVAVSWRASTVTITDCAAANDTHAAVVGVAVAVEATHAVW